jgi:FixJ family two-component response regulator
MKTLYLIDDDKDFRDILEMYINQKYPDVEFVTFPTADEFYMHMKEKKRADIIICDYEMPGSNGVDLFFKLKQENMLENTKFYILSAYITFGLKNVQGADFLSKKKPIQETLKRILE